MPRSTNIFKKETIEFIKNNFSRDTSILDIGAGCGTYSDLLKTEYNNMDGLEVFPPYVDTYGLKEKYNNLFIQDTVTFDFEHYDLVILGDVLEHIPEEDAINYIEKIYPKCDDMIVAIPFNSPQGVHEDNEHEIHRQEHLTNESFLEKYKGFKVFCLRYDYGIYIKDIPKNEDIEIYVDPVNINFDEVVGHLQNTYQKSRILDYSSYESPEKIVVPPMEIINNELTVVTGLWNIGRPGRSFDNYIENFRKFLEIPIKMFIYIPKEYEYLVWEKRSEENTYVKIWELEDLKLLYQPHWDKTQEIRTDPNWYNQTGEGGWLKSSPQAVLEWYNPIVQSKMFLVNNATIWNPFNNEYFIWLDAGITNTVYEKFFTEERVLDKILPHLDSFLFLSYPYQATDEIHGFNFEAMNRYAGQKVEYVCRGGLFGGKRGYKSSKRYVLFHTTKYIKCGLYGD